MRLGRRASTELVGTPDANHSEVATSQRERMKMRMRNSCAGIRGAAWARAAPLAVVVPQGAGASQMTASDGRPALFVTSVVSVDAPTCRRTSR
jgi:hypothetical protein